jgi:hypothetical protein
MWLFKVVQVLLTWLTMAATLLAAVPHFDCVCPNGNRKPYCFNVSSKRNSCCCGGACCSTSTAQSCCQAKQLESDGPGKGMPCCKSKQQSNTNAATSIDKVEGSRCKKTLAQGVVVIVTPKNVTAKNSPTGASTVPPLDVVVLPAVLSHSLFSWNNFRLPPPTDLIVAFQHFLV